MNELISHITNKTGLGAEQATAVVQLVFDFLKTKLPAPLTAQLEGFMSPEGTAAASAGGVAGAAQSALSGIGSMFKR